MVVSLASFSLLVGNPFNEYMFPLLQEIVELNGWTPSLQHDQME